MKRNLFEKYSYIPVLATSLLYFFGAYSFWQKGQIIAVISFLVVGIFFLLFAYLITVGKTKILSEKEIEDIKTKGIKIISEFKALDRKWNVRVNGQSPIVIYSQAKNEKTGKMETFESPSLWFSGADASEYENPAFKAWQTLQNTDTSKQYLIPVYVDSKTGFYFMDVGGLEVKAK